MNRPQTQEDQEAHDRFWGRIVDSPHDQSDPEALDNDAGNDAGNRVECKACDKKLVAWLWCANNCGKQLCRGWITCNRERQQWCEDCRKELQILPCVLSSKRIKEENSSTMQLTFHYPMNIVRKAGFAGVHPRQLEENIQRGILVRGPVLRG